MIRRTSRPQRRRLADRVATARRNTVRKDYAARNDERIAKLRRRVAQLRTELRRAEAEETPEVRLAARRRRPLGRVARREAPVARRRPVRDRLARRPVGKRLARERISRRPERPIRTRPSVRRPMDRRARRENFAELDVRREERLATLRERLDQERRRERRLSSRLNRPAGRPVRRSARRVAAKNVPLYIRHKRTGKIYIRDDQ